MYSHQGEQCVQCRGYRINELLDWETQGKLREVVTPSLWKNVGSRIPDTPVNKVYLPGWLSGQAGFWGQTEEQKGTQWREPHGRPCLCRRWLLCICPLSTPPGPGVHRLESALMRSGQLCQGVRNGPTTGSEHLKKGILRQHEGMFLWQQKLEVIIHKIARLRIVLIRKTDKWHKTSIILASFLCDLLKTA